MKLPPLPTGENMFFHPVLACPRCKLPLGIAIARVYDFMGQIADPNACELRATCLWGCNYEQTLDDLSCAAVIEGPRLCLDCGQIHVKDAVGSYCPNHRMQKSEEK